jgi:hypothetical protein
MASNPQKPTAPMPLMVFSMGLALIVIYEVIKPDYGSTAAAIMVGCCAPFVVYFLISNRSADGSHFVLDKNPPASLACWARRAVIFCMVLAFFFGQPRPAVTFRNTALVIAGVLFLLLLATPRWGSRFPPLAWAAVAVQFDMPPLNPWLFLGTLVGVAVLAIWRYRRRQLSRQPL